MPDPRWFECPVLIPYMGGKFELSKKLIPMMPKHNRYIEPFVGVSRPAKQWRRVDFPDPEGPIIAVNSPEKNSMSILSRAMTLVSCSP